MTKASLIAVDEKYRSLASDVVRVTTLLRTNEKKVEQQRETIDNLEKFRDNQIKNATENAETVSVGACNCWTSFCKCLETPTKCAS